MQNARQPEIMPGLIVALLNNNWHDLVFCMCDVAVNAGDVFQFDKASCLIADLELQTVD